MHAQVSEKKMVGLMRQLPPAAIQEVHDFIVFLVARHASWTYNDINSTNRAVAMMASDTFVSREIRAINEDFSSVEADGLDSCP